MNKPTIKLTIVESDNFITIDSDTFKFSLGRNMYNINDKAVDGIGCQVNNEKDRLHIEKLCITISDAINDFLNKNIDTE